jgi:retinol dehydrogenase 12
MLATNTIGPFLLTKLLEPILLRTARQSVPGSVRIVWVASIIALGSPKGGVVWDNRTGAPKLFKDPSTNYMQSKAGLVFLAHEYARKLGRAGIISVVKSHLTCERITQSLLTAYSRYIQGC